MHGEYGRAFLGKANIYKINSDPLSSLKEKELHIPFWALNAEELCELCFGGFNNEKDRNLILERIQSYKYPSLAKNPKAGVTADNLSADTPIPFSIHTLWHELFIETFGTYYRERGGKPIDNLAYEKDNKGKELKGNSSKGIAPVFRNIVTEAGAEKINYLPNSLSIGKQVQLLGSKLRLPRYNFMFQPGDWTPDENGKVKKDLDSLLKGWIGEKPVSILDLSGIPTEVLQTTISALLRILYEALFWSRNLSQGGKHRPLLIVMEEAHAYLNNDANEMASGIVQRIVKEGRKYGISAMIVSQRPSEINPTILSQCGTFFALRLNNATDRSHITSAMSDNLEGLTSMLPILRTGEAIILGEAVKLPMRTTIEPPERSKRPDSQDPIIYDETSPESSLNPGGWGIPMENDPNYEEVVETWRAQNPRIGKIKL